MSISAVADLLLPPASLAVLALLLLVFWRRWGRSCAALLLLLLVILSMPAIGNALLQALDPGDPPGGGPPPQAIVILAADVERTGIPGLGEVGAMTLERERAGAALARRTGLPVLVTGGLVTTPPPVGALMAASMASDFNVPVRWAEVASATTWENARFSEPMLRTAGIGRVYLVTHAWHMRRSLLAFRRAGIDAVPAVVRHDAAPEWGAWEFVPRVSGWSRSYIALHEWLGLLFYELRP